LRPEARIEDALATRPRNAGVKGQLFAGKQQFEGAACNTRTPLKMR
jgi:hypothetical protein